MTAPEIDPRYPAEFQRGGEAIPAWTEKQAAREPALPPSSSLPVQAVIRRPEPSLPTPETQVPHGAPEMVAVVSERDEPFPSSVEETQRPWSLALWLRGFGLVAAALVVSIILMTVYLWMPPKGANGSFPSGQDGAVAIQVLLIQIAPMFFIAAWILFAVMLIVGTAQHLNRRWLLRSMALLVGVLLTGLGVFSIFASTIFPTEIYGDMSGDQQKRPFPWSLLIYWGTTPLLMVGMGIVLAVFGTRGLRTGKTAWSGNGLLIAGAVVTLLGVVALLAPELFPQVAKAAAEKPIAENTYYVPQPWTYTIMGVGPAMLLVGAASVLGGLFINAIKGNASAAAEQLALQKAHNAEPEEPQLMFQETERPHFE